MTHDYEVTHNEDGTFSISLPDGDELRIVPPKKEWVGLTDEDYAEVSPSHHRAFILGARWAEDKLKEKNT